MDQAFIRRKDMVVWKLVDGKAFLLNLDNGDYFDINLTGLALWKLCDGKRTVVSIVSQAASRLKVKPEKIHKDAVLFIQSLKKNKLAEIVSKPTPAIKRC